MTLQRFPSRFTDRRIRVALILLSVVWSCAIPRVLTAEDELSEAPIADSDRDHWAFQPIRRPDLPQILHSEWPQTGIDAFILARLEAKQIEPAAEADRTTLLRRLSFDLMGLPPTPDEVLSFEGDTSPDAFERQVDRLLASPAYGERWSQHWLDLARFAETDGFEHDKVRPEAWRYRDWVIDALNADLPYREFVTGQIAGDQKSEQGADGRSSPLHGAVPTMFLLSGPDMPDQNDQLERRHNLLNELTSTAGSVLLGLQVGCAQCHDHKYDPISQADFYRLRGVFESAVPQLKRDKPCNVLTVQTDAPPARLWIRGDHNRPGPMVEPGFPRIADSADPSETDVGNEAEGATDRYRSTFATWLFRDDNPLTARVMANRVWQHHFGRGIFDTPSDVGLINAGPTHPELLDWLASEFRERGWNLKQLHRTIVGSATYREASRNTGAAEPQWAERLGRDPANERYSRFMRRRLDGETLRDAMLTSAGLLSSERGGPGVMPPLPEELTSTLLSGQWTPSTREAEHYRRSIYLFARRNLRYPIFEAFDRPDANASCTVRSRTTTAPQSLVLLNSEFSLLAAQTLANRVAAEATQHGRQAELVYLYALSRRPTGIERGRFVAFLSENQIPPGSAASATALPAKADATAANDAAATALVDACLAIFNTSEFLYVD
jgi:hypothetical protein